MNTVTLTQQFNAPIEQVWAAITEPEKMKDWYFFVRDFELAEGSVFSFYETEQDGEFLHECEILTVKPMQLFEHTWEHPTHSDGVSNLKWILERKNENETILTIEHSGLENFADAGPAFSAENYALGWKGILGNSLRNYLYGIEKQNFSIEIKASPEKVWHTLWNKEKYQQWTSIFSDGSHYVGEIVESGRVHLLSANNDGMYSDVILLVENELLVFSHIGYVADKKEQPIDEDTKIWTGALESYKLTATEQGTRLDVALDNQKEHHDHMNEKFPKALQRLKELSEA